MKKANNAWFTLTLVVVALLSALGSSAEADYQDWRFDDGTFEARLHDDWLMHDASNVESDGPLFAARTDVAPERALITNVLADVREYDEDAGCVRSGYKKECYVCTEVRNILAKAIGEKALPLRAYYSEAEYKDDREDR